LPKYVLCKYNQRGPFCACVLNMRPFHKNEVLFVQYVLLSIKQRICLCLHKLQEYISRWLKPSTASLALGTFADLTRGKAELFAENALLRQQLIILRREVKQPVYRKRDRLLLVVLVHEQGENVIFLLSCQGISLPIY
jgi:putative transposase